MACERRYTTFEEVEYSRPIIVKKDGRREIFDKSKIMESMSIACRKRPVPTAMIVAAADEVERKLIELGENETPSTQIGELVLEKLSEIDPVAYVRFASVYHEFEDATDFRKLIASIRQDNKSRAHANM
jgi:transcriptional repressor NrdR